MLFEEGWSLDILTAGVSPSFSSEVDDRAAALKNIVKKMKAFYRYNITPNSFFNSFLFDLNSNKK